MNKNYFKFIEAIGQSINVKLDILNIDDKYVIAKTAHGLQNSIFHSLYDKSNDSGYLLDMMFGNFYEYINSTSHWERIDSIGVKEAYYINMIKQYENK
jgi:hypothetical protein